MIEIHKITHCAQVYPTERYLEVNSSDGVQIKVVLLNLDTAKLGKVYCKIYKLYINAHIQQINAFKVNTFIEVIGKVMTPTELQADYNKIIQFGDDFGELDSDSDSTGLSLTIDIDMKLANDVVELWHDPRFAKMVEQ